MSKVSAEDSSNNSYVIDAESPTEMARLVNLDRMITGGMGGPLAGLPNRLLKNVLDVACGPGGWVLDVAFSYPYVEVAGIDISRTMVDYANTRARTQHLTNASFGVMNINEPLDFPDDAFDLVNARFLVGVLKREKWRPLLTECTRILCPDGILRLTEPIDYGSTTSSAYNYLMALGAQAVYRAGYGFSVNEFSFDMTHMLAPLLRNAGYQDIHSMAHALEVSADTENWTAFYQMADVTCQMIQPFLVKTGVTTDEEMRDIHQQLLLEIKQKDFCGMWNYITTWGYKPQE